VEAIAGGDGEAREGLLVAVLRPSDQLGIHALSAWKRSADPAAYTVWAGSTPVRYNLRWPGRPADHVVRSGAVSALTAATAVRSGGTSVSLVETRCAGTM
jgi:hypothetical protein